MMSRIAVALVPGLVVWSAVAGGAPLAAQNALNVETVRSARVTFAPVFDAHEQLATRFRTLWSAATGPRSSVHDRVSFLAFLHRELITQLDREGLVLYPKFDSLTTGSYATTAALFDRAVIGRLIHELGDSVAYRDSTVFKARSYALAVALEGYFTKTEFLVLPVVHDRLSASDVEELLARL
jgi:hypothetical protein